MTQFGQLTWLSVVVVMVVTLTARCVNGVNLRIEQFYSHSFVPTKILVGYSVEPDKEGINYNVTFLESFAGKLLMNVYIRNLPDQPGTPAVIFVRLRNMDFCQSLELGRNVTNTMLQPGFFIRCPLVPATYYLEQQKFPLKSLPGRVPDGRYQFQVELIQVYEEVVLLMNLKIMYTQLTPPDEREPDLSWSNEYYNNKKKKEVDKGSEEEEEDE